MVVYGLLRRPEMMSVHKPILLRNSYLLAILHDLLLKFTIEIHSQRLAGSFLILDEHLECRELSIKEGDMVAGKKYCERRP